MIGDENNLTKHIQHFISLLKSVDGVNIQAKDNAVDVILTVFPKGILFCFLPEIKAEFRDGPSLYGEVKRSNVMVRGH